MARKKRYIRGRVYKINDSLLVKSHKKNRRIVALNNDPNNMVVRRIFTIKDNNKARLLPIEKYPDIPNVSGAENKVFRHTLTKKPIQERYLHKTKTRINKWDLKKIGIYKK